MVIVSHVGTVVHILLKLTALARRTARYAAHRDRLDDRVARRIQHSHFFALLAEHGEPRATRRMVLHYSSTNLAAMGLETSMTLR